MTGPAKEFADAYRKAWCPICNMRPMVFRCGKGPVTDIFGRVLGSRIRYLSCRCGRVVIAEIKP